MPIAIVNQLIGFYSLCIWGWLLEVTHVENTRTCVTFMVKITTKAVEFYVNLENFLNKNLHCLYLQVPMYFFYF